MLEKKNRRLAAAALVVATSLGGAFAIHAQDKREPLDLGTKRWLAHLTTDKPLYRPGEVVYARAALLDAFSRAPADGAAWANFQVRSPRGDVVFSTVASGQGAVVPFSWRIPEGISGGEYKLVIQLPNEGLPESETSFDVRSYRVPRINTDLEFAKKAYGPGDLVSATLKAVRAEGGVPVGATATAVATVDGVEVHRSEVALDQDGRCTVTFSIPGQVKDGEGTLALVVRDGGVQETAAKTIPIVVNRVKLTLFPEGGDLVQGVENRLYFEARTPKGKPATVAGRIVFVSNGTVAARFKSGHEGRGRVAFTPTVAGSAYTLVLDEPAGCTDAIPLPPVTAGGFALSALDDSASPGAPIRVRVASPVGGKARLVLSQKEKELSSLELELDAGRAQEAMLAPPSAIDGVLRVTVLDEKDVPRAERLVFRRPRHSVKVELEASPPRASLRDPIKVTVRTKDELGNPVATTVTLSAVDDSVLETVERRERAPRLPVQALLGGEVKELMDAQAYLEGENAAEKVDLLLGTQGWRRFAFADPEKFLAANGAAGARALAIRKPQPALARAAGGGGRFGRKEAAAEAEKKAIDAAAPRQAPEAPPAPRPMMPQAAEAADHNEAADGEVFAKRKGDDMEGIGAGAGAGKDARRFGGRIGMKPQQATPVVREYAHQAAKTAERSDFSETLYWNAGLATNEKGEATFAFALADSVTTFRLRADAFSGAGALGAGDATVESRRGFYVEPKLPLEVTAGDRVEVPVAVINGTTGALDALLECTTVGPFALGEGAGLRISLAPDGRGRLLLPFTAKMGNGDAAVRIKASAGSASDDVSRTLHVVPAGFPIELSLGGQLEAQTIHTIRIPEGVEPGSLVTEGLVYPSPLASLSQAVAALLREPCGCFEQTSSSNYPNVMALQYFSSHQGVEPQLRERASKLLDAGYKKLVGFECKEKGYEWFGQGNGHEALTAYGVMEFTDMTGLAPVDQEMLARTRTWLLSQRDGKGSFKRNARALDSFGGAPQDVTDAYITWSLSLAHVAGIEKEIAAVRERAAATEDAYYLALAANVLLDAKDPAAKNVIERLAKKQDAQGSLKGAATSITGSGGEALEIETTSLAVLAWLRSPEQTACCEKAMRWLLERAKGGRFGSTQSTILALKAIVAYDAAHAKPKKAGAVLLVVDGKVYDEKPFTAETQGAITLPSFAEALTPGEHKVELKLVGGAPMPYSLSARYHARTPASSAACKVSLATKLVASEVREGEPVDLRVELVNKTGTELPMTVAIVGLPGGLEARAEQLKELVKQGKIDFFETRGRDLVLYRRGMAKAEKLELVVSLVAQIPGSYTGAASRAYLYYQDEDKHWVEPVAVKIKASFPGEAK